MDMRNTRFKALKYSALLLVGTALFVAELAHAKPHSKGLSMRQPKKAAVTQKVSKQKAARFEKADLQMRHRMQTARASAERLEEQVPVYLNALSLNAFQRWSKGVDLNILRKDFAAGMLVHLQAVSDLMKLRHERGGHLPGFHDFAFKNLLNKSDYLLSLDLTKDSLELTSAQGRDLGSFNKILRTYNAERARFDNKTIRLASLPE